MGNNYDANMSHHLVFPEDDLEVLHVTESVHDKCLT